MDITQYRQTHSCEYFMCGGAPVYQRRREPGTKRRLSLRENRRIGRQQWDAAPGGVRDAQASPSQQALTFDHVFVTAGSGCGHYVRRPLLREHDDKGKNRDRDPNGKVSAQMR